MPACHSCRRFQQCVGVKGRDGGEEFQPEFRISDTAEIKKKKATGLEAQLKKDRKCKSLLISRIHDTQLEYVQGKQTPKDIWDALQNVFERKSIASRMYLKRKMLSLRLDGGTLQEHFLAFDKVVREYRATGAPLDELDVVCNLLLTMDSRYATVVTAIETMPEEKLSLEFAKCRLLDEETKQKNVDNGSCQNDQCLYIWKTEKGAVIMLIYVDDIIIAGTSLRLVETVKNCLAHEFEMTDAGK